VPWLRVKEVWLHALDIGADPAGLPADVVDAVLHDVAESFAARADVPALQVIAADSGARCEIGTGGIEVRGPAAGLLTWLTGRSTGADLHCTEPLAELPNWA
jgi:maleylpyruvate isomerase